MFPFITQDIVKDNKFFYENKQSETNIFNISLLAGLSSQKSQTDNDSEIRQNNINYFEHSIRNLLEKSKYFETYREYPMNDTLLYKPFTNCISNKEMYASKSLFYKEQNVIPWNSPF